MDSCINSIAISVVVSYIHPCKTSYLVEVFTESRAYGQERVRADHWDHITNKNSLVPLTFAEEDHGVAGQ